MLNLYSGYILISINLEEVVTGKKLVLKSTDRVGKFNELNNTEKYIFLKFH